MAKTEIPREPDSNDGDSDDHPLHRLLRSRPDISDGVEGDAEVVQIWMDSPIELLRDLEELLAATRAAVIEPSQKVPFTTLQVVRPGTERVHLLLDWLYRDLYRRLRVFASLTQTPIDESTVLRLADTLSDSTLYLASFERCRKLERGEDTPLEYLSEDSEDNLGEALRKLDDEIDVLHAWCLCLSHHKQSSKKKAGGEPTQAEVDNVRACIDHLDTCAGGYTRDATLNLLRERGQGIGTHKLHRCMFRIAEEDSRTPRTQRTDPS